MAVKNQKIIVGELDNPDFIFENDDVISVEGLFGCSISGDNLSIDTFTPVVNCKYGGPEIIIPKKEHKFEGIKLKDEYKNTNGSRSFRTGVTLTKNAEISIRFKLIDSSSPDDIGYSVLWGFHQLISGGDYPNVAKVWSGEFWNTNNSSEVYMHYYVISNTKRNVVTDNMSHTLTYKLIEKTSTIGSPYAVGYIKLDDSIILDVSSIATDSYMQDWDELSLLGCKTSDSRVPVHGRNWGCIRSSNIIFESFYIKDSDVNGDDYRLRHEFIPTIQNGVVCMRHYDYTNEDNIDISYIYCDGEENPYEIVSVEYENDTNYEGFLTLDEKVLSGHYVEENIQELNYGTKVWYYIDEHLVGQFYIDTVEEVSKTQYKLNTVSLIGLLDKQESYGGLYNMERFDKVLNDIMYSKIKAPYTKAEYIYGTGTQCLDTEYLQDTNNASITVKFRSLGSSETCLFGASKQSVYVSANTITRKVAPYSGEDKESITSQYNFNTTDIYEIILYSSSIVVNNKTTGSYSGVLCEGTSTYSTDIGTSIYLLADNINGTPVNFCQANIYSFKIGFFNGVPYRKENDSTGVLRNETNRPDLIDYGTFHGSITSYPLNVYPTSENADLNDESDSDEIDIEFLNGVDSILVSGWLPADTKRKNLHRLLLATNVSIIKKENGGILLTPLVNIPTKTINDIDIYNEGSVTYTRLISNAYVTEHEYYDSGLESETTLYDNTDISGIADKEQVKFSSSPIIIDSLNTTGTLSIDQANENFAIVSGKGKLFGTPYTHISREIKKFPIQESKIIQNNIASITDCTLINSINGESVLERLWAYKAKSYTVKGVMTYNGEKCGQSIITKTPYSKIINAFIDKMTLYVSAKVKADVELIVGYNPPTIDSDYTSYVILTGSGVWNVPNGITRIKAVLIGGGDGGHAGFAGEQGNEGQNSREAQDGGEGGDPGEAGECGYVREVTITSLAVSYSYSCGDGGDGGRAGSGGGSGFSGEETHFGSYRTGPSYGGYKPTKGIHNIFTGQVYCLPGISNGVKGGHGGARNPADHGITPHGEDVAFNGKVYKGGVGRYEKYAGPPGLYNYGGGAAVGQNGFGGGELNYRAHAYSESFYPDNIGNDPYVTSLGAYNISGGAGGSPMPREDMTVYGSGGYGGHGGGGGGASGYYYNESISHGYAGHPGEGGAGGRGGKGGPGCIIIYY